MADDLDTLTKDELLAEAESLGVDAKSTDTKAEIVAKIRAETDGAPDPAADEPAPAPEVVVVNPNRAVDNFNARSDDDAYTGGFVDVVAGEHQGVYGQYVDTVEWGDDGYPTSVLVRPRDADANLLVVDYADVRNSQRAGGR